MDVSRWWITLDESCEWEHNNSREPLIVFTYQYDFLRLDYEAYLLAIL